MLDVEIYGREQFQIKLGTEEINRPVIICEITTVCVGIINRIEEALFFVLEKVLDCKT